MSMNFATLKLVDGASLNVDDGYGYTSDWVDVHSSSGISVSVVFTGGAPAGTVKLQQSNDRQWTGSAVVPLISVGADNSSGTTKVVSDIADVPTGTGAVSASVAAAGVVYVMNQFLAPYRWLRVVYTPSMNSNTQLDVFVNIKG